MPGNVASPAVTDRYEVAKRRAIALLGAFSMVLAFFTATSLQESLEQRRLAVGVRGWTDLTTRVSGAIHELQRERGLSSGYLGSASERFGEALRRQHGATDAALAALATELPASGRPMPAWSDDGTPATAGLAVARELVAERRIGREAVTTRYSVLIDGLLALMLEGAGTTGDLVGEQMAYISLLRAKEAAGQERALLTSVFSSGEFGHFSRVANFHQLRAIEQTQFDQFRRLASPDAVARLDVIEAGEAAREIDAVRRRFVAIGHSAPNPDSALPAAEHWFAVASARIDAIKSLEDALGAALRDHARTHEHNAYRGLLLNGFSALSSLLLGALLLALVRRGKEEAESSLRLAGKVFANSVEAIVVTDPDCRLIEVNAAFTRITGYAREEVLGQHVRLLKSGRHDQAFYEAMWARILSEGSWEGEIWNRRRNGDIYPALLSVVEVRSPAGAVVNYIAMTVDLSQHKKTEALLEQLRTFDPLTGLLSRDAWLSAIDRAVANARDTSRCFAILEIGVDRFKLINDSLSHAAGDRVLAHAAERIRRALRRHDAAARPGGDRFSVLLDDIDSVQNTGTICEKILAAFLPPMEIDGHRLHVSVSIGVAMFPADGDRTTELMRHAELAMYRAKDGGRAAYHFYSEEMNVEGAELLALEAMLRQALTRGEFSVVYQPQVDLAHGTLVGVEALLRWKNPELGPVSPVQFIPLAEDTGLIVPIGEWVLRQACVQAAAWRDRYGTAIPVAVNLSARQFSKKDLMSEIRKALDDSGLPAESLELEITEGSLISDPAGAGEILRGLRAMGVRTAIDDFGTGYSSLAYLKLFPLDRLKIDRAFVKDLPGSASDAAIARAVVTLGRHLGMEVLAEGVEESVQRDFLADAGCHVVQGYLYGKPMSPEQLQENIERGTLPLHPRQGGSDR